jgi:hypothetical protein
LKIGRFLAQLRNGSATAQAELERSKSRNFANE